jgi:hypothetical protein
MMCFSRDQGIDSIHSIQNQSAIRLENNDRPVGLSTFGDHGVQAAMQRTAPAPAL